MMGHGRCMCTMCANHSKLNGEGDDFAKGRWDALC